MSTTPTLSWTAGSGATSHDVYFGTSSSPPFVTNTTGTSYNPGSLSIGTTYYWKVVAKNSGGSTSSAIWSFTTSPSGSGNDEPSGATLIASLPFSTTQNTQAATSNASDPGHSCTGGQKDSNTVWFRYVATFTGKLRVNTFGSNYDTVLTAYPGTTAPGAELACSDDENATSQSAIVFNVTSGQSYLIQVSDYGSPDGGTLVLNVSRGVTVSKIGVAGAGYLMQDANGNFGWDGTPADRYIYWGSGAAGEVLVFGDWNGDGKTKVGSYKDGLWILDYNGNGVWDAGVDKILYFGSAGFQPVVGDWNGTGTSKIGVYKDGLWILDHNGNFQWDGTSLDKLVYFGASGQSAVVGDWNGDGRTKIGVYKDGLWVLDYNGNFLWDGTSVDKLVYFGASGQAPVVGDWNGSGNTKIGVHRDGLWVLDYNGDFIWNGTGTDKLVYFGASGYTGIVGDWNGSGWAKIGGYKDGLWVLDYNGDFAWNGTGTDKLVYFGTTGQTPALGGW